MNAAVAASSKDSCAITWHQWQAAYPTLSSTGTSRRRASSNASGPHSHQCTGLSLCWSRYGDVASASRFTMSLASRHRSPEGARPNRAPSRPCGSPGTTYYNTPSQHPCLPPPLPTRDATLQPAS